MVAVLGGIKAGRRLCFIHERRVGGCLVFVCIFASRNVSFYRRIFISKEASGGSSFSLIMGVAAGAMTAPAIEFVFM